MEYVTDLFLASSPDEEQQKPDTSQSCTSSEITCETKGNAFYRKKNGVGVDFILRHASESSQRNLKYTVSE